jgi:hypothetical protein
MGVSTHLERPLLRVARNNELNRKTGFGPKAAWRMIQAWQDRAAKWIAGRIFNGPGLFLSCESRKGVYRSVMGAVRAMDTCMRISQISSLLFLL